jgi:hypothetical protein
MKRIVFSSIFLLFNLFAANAQLSQSELNQLSSVQREIYNKQYNELTQAIKTAEYDLFKAEDRIKMGEEMNREEGNKAGNLYIAQGMEMKEKALKAKRDAEQGLQLLYEAAREAIRNNRNKPES